MSKAAPIISNTIRHDFSPVETELPKNSTNFITLYEYEGYGDFHGASFKFDADGFRFKFEIDGFVVSDTDVEDLNDFLGKLGKHEVSPSSAIYYNNSEKVLEIAFNFPIQFKTSIKMSAHSNDNKDRDSKGYSVFLTKDNT